MPHGSPRFVHGKILHNTGSGIFYRMEVAIPERIDFVPGQFAMVSGWPGNDPLLPRPLAIFRSGGVRGRGTVEFVYKVVGRGTALLSGLHAGDPLALTLPLGHGFEFPGEDRSWWLVGGGVGFSSVFPAAVALEGQRADFEIFLGARTRDQLPPGEWIPGGAVPGRVHLCTDDGTAGFFGTAAAALRDRIDRRKSSGPVARLDPRVRAPRDAEGHRGTRPPPRHPGPGLPRKLDGVRFRRLLGVRHGDPGRREVRVSKGLQGRTGLRREGGRLVTHSVTPDLSARVGSVLLKNPVMSASGTFGYGLEFMPFYDISRLGAVIVKGLSLLPTPGNRPRADRGDPRGDAERDRPAEHRGRAVRERGGAASGRRRRRVRRERLRTHDRGVRGGGAPSLRSPRARGDRGERLLPQREGGGDRLRFESRGAFRTHPAGACRHGESRCG